MRGKGHDDALMVHDFELMELDRRELLPHRALPLRRGGPRPRRPPRHRGHRRDRGGGPEPAARRRDDRCGQATDVLRRTPSTRLPARSHAPGDQGACRPRQEPPERRPLVDRQRAGDDTEEARAYFAPLLDLTRELDPSRPVGVVNMFLAPADRCRVSDLCDLVMINRYHGWYVDTGDLAAAEIKLEAELRAWAALGKPVIVTEYGADALAGLHAVGDVPWTEDYQAAVLEMSHRVFDRVDAVVGEHVWNFADFATSLGVTRVDGNKKGVFTRDRRPKAAAHALRRRWRETKGAVVTETTVRTGLVGAGPWATVMHAPLLAGGPGTSLEAVWARREDAATELARQYGASVAGSFDELLETVRRHRVRRAARRPGSTWRPGQPRPASTCCSRSRWPSASPTPNGSRTRSTRRESARSCSSPTGSPRRAASSCAAPRRPSPRPPRPRSLGGGSLPGSFFATPWRVARGALLDLGPHVLDLLVAALGPVAEITATGDPTRVVALTTRHESGVLGQALLSITTADAEDAMVCHVHTDSGPVVFDSRSVTDDAALLSTIAREFSESVRTGVPHELDVHRGLMLQRLLEQAEASLVS